MPPKETKGEVGSRSGWLKKCFAHTAAYSVFNPKNSTGRSPIFFGVFGPFWVPKCTFPGANLIVIGSGKWISAELYI